MDTIDYYKMFNHEKRTKSDTVKGYARMSIELIQKKFNRMNNQYGSSKKMRKM